MRAVVTRVSSASVDVKCERVGAIGQGLLILLGVAPTDGAGEVDWLAAKVSELRIFGDDQGRMNRSLLEVGGEALVVSQFTLYGDPRRGRRPSYTGAAPPELAEPLYEAFARALRARGVGVATGRFGAMMEVASVNQGPLTLIVDTP